MVRRLWIKSDSKYLADLEDTVFRPLADILQMQHQPHKSIHYSPLPPFICPEAVSLCVLCFVGFYRSIWNCDDTYIDVPMQSCPASMEQSVTWHLPQHDHLLVYKRRFFDPWWYHHLDPSNASDIQLETPSQPEIVTHVCFRSRILVSPFITAVKFSSAHRCP
jgi:hypothetical protein